MGDLIERIREAQAEGVGDAKVFNLLDEAAAALSQQRAVPEGYVQISKTALRGMIGDEAMAQIEAACVYPVAAAKKEGE